MVEGIPEGLEELFQQTWFDHLLHYGLLLGAVFQLICIAAIVVLPPKAEEEADEASSSGEGEGPVSSQAGGREDSAAHTQGQVVKGGMAGGSGKKSKKVRKRK